MAWPDRRRTRVRGAARRLRRWAATAEPPLEAYLADLDWDWWPVSAHPWNASQPPRPTVEARRFVVETFAAKRPVWAEAGRRWHAGHPDQPAPIASIWIVPNDLYRCELRLEVDARARVFREEWASDDRPDRPMPLWLSGAAPDLLWRPTWRWEAWHEDDLEWMTPTQRRRLDHFGPITPSTVTPGYLVVRAGIGWTGVDPADID